MLGSFMFAEVKVTIIYFVYFNQQKKCHNGNCENVNLQNQP